MLYCVALFSIAVPGTENHCCEAWKIFAGHCEFPILAISKGRNTDKPESSVIITADVFR